MSLPAWGAWIEIKLDANHVKLDVSLPAWGAWIEMIAPDKPPETHSVSLPAWGAWIEMLAVHVGNLGAKSLPAWGAWIEIISVRGIAALDLVAPRMGSVD